MQTWLSALLPEQWLRGRLRTVPITVNRASITPGAMVGVAGIATGEIVGPLRRRRGGAPRP